MQAKLALVGDVHAQVKSLETEKNEFGKALIESTQINKQLKSLLQEKDKIIEKMQSEMEKFVVIKKELEPVFKESGELKKQIASKDQEILELNQSLSQATQIVEQVPNLEIYVKQASAALKEIGDDNIKLREQVDSPFTAADRQDR